MDEKGDVVIASALLDQGAGTYTVLCEIVAEELKVPLDKIQAKPLDTRSGRKDTGVGASRATRVYGNAAYEAAIKAKEEIRKTAAQYLGCHLDDVIIANGGVIHRSAERRMTYSDLVKAKGSPFKVEGHYKDLSKAHEASMCVQVAEVEVDCETGEINLKKLTSAHHTGTVLNPLTHQGQIEGGSVMGVGYALMEDLIVDGGKVLTTNFGEYKIPTIQDIPALKTVVKEVLTGPGPYHSMRSRRNTTVRPAFTSSFTLLSSGKR